MTNAEKIKSLIEVVIEKPLTVEDRLLDDGVLDSLKTLDLIYKLEDEFDIEIELDEVTHFDFNSIENLIKLIERC